MKCEEFKKKVEDFITGELGKTEMESLRKHQKECGECRKLYLKRRETRAGGPLPGELYAVDLPENLQKTLLSMEKQHVMSKRSIAVKKAAEPFTQKLKKTVKDSFGPGRTTLAKPAFGALYSEKQKEKKDDKGPKPGKKGKSL